MNAILINLGFIQIRWYSVLLLVAFIVGSLLILKEGQRFKIDKEYLDNIKSIAEKRLDVSNAIIVYNLLENKKMNGE